MILFERSYPATLATLAQTLQGQDLQTWTFDDTPTRRAAEAAFAARGIKARCHSAYKPLLCAFRDGLGKDVVSATITYPRHPDAKANRFLLETYPLRELYPQIAFSFVEGAEVDALPTYDLVLTDAKGDQTKVSLLAPNRSHLDTSHSKVLSPCGYMILDGKAQSLTTDFEALFHDAIAAILAGPWEKEPYFQEMHILATLPQTDEVLGFGEEALSLREALHEDFYFSGIEIFQRLSGRAIGDRHLRPGQILPNILQGPEISVKIELRPYDAQAISTHMQDLETATCPLSQVQIKAELDAIKGIPFEAISVAGRPVWGRYHEGSDRGVFISTGQHANETSSPVGALRAVKRLLKSKGAHFVLSPLENPDGYAVHQRLIADNPRHMHHAARYTALGDDLEYRTGDQLWEKAIHHKAAEHLPALLHLNLHGYPSHEWTRPLSGYVPLTFEMWTIPKGFFLIMRHRPGWAKPARALMDQVTKDLNLTPGLRAFNEAQIASFEAHAGETGFEILNGFPVMISEDLRHKIPLTLITEYPDETVYDAAFQAAHEAQMAVVLSAYRTLQDLDISGVPNA